MKKSEQTDKMKERLYFLTLQFIRKYQPRYYKQYKGEQEDLAMQFFCEFLTEKSREKGKEASLLDKFNPAITTLEYLVKVSVQRMLIDCSRKDSIQFRSIDFYTDEFGDVVSKAFGLTTEDDEEETVDSRVFTSDEIVTLKLNWADLNCVSQKRITKQFEEAKAALIPSYRAVLEDVIYSV